MVKYCVMRSCPNRDLETKDAKKLGKNHHSFPTNEDDRAQWIGFVQKYNRTPDWTILGRRGAFLCSEHFEKEYIMQTGRIARSAVPTLALKFTAKTAHKFGLIPSLHSHLLADVNNFEKDLKDLIIESEEEEHPCTPPPVPDAFDYVIDMPLKPLNRNSNVQSPPHYRTECAVQVLRVEPSENVGRMCSTPTHDFLDDMEMPMTPLIQNVGDDEPLDGGICTENSDDKQRLLGQTSSFDSMKMNASGGPKDLAAPTKPAPRKRKLHIGDLSFSDFETRPKAEATLQKIKKKFSSARHKSRMQLQRLRRSKKRIHDLESKLSHLEDKRLIMAELSDLIKVKDRCCECVCTSVKVCDED